MTIPEPILQLLKEHCERTEFGMIQLTHESGISVLIFGPQRVPAGLTAVAGAAMLLNDLLSGRLDQSNANPESKESVERVQ